MKSFQNISLFKLVLLISINIFVNNKILLILSLIYLLFLDRKYLIIYIIIFSIISLSNVKNDFIKYGIVDEISKRYVIVDKILYKTKVYSTEYSIGDIIEFKDSSDKINDESSKKYNILFTYNKDTEYLTTIVTRKYINELINAKENINLSNYLKKILLNDYVQDNDIEYLGYGFSFYYLLLILLKKDSRITLVILILYILLFSFQIKFFLLIIDILLIKKKVNQITKICIKILFILLINKYLLLNYSILISILFTLILNTEFKEKSYLCIVQSLLFNQIQPFTCFFYRYLIKIRIVFFFLSLITLFIDQFNYLYLAILNTYIKIMKVLNFSIRGRISLVSFLIVLFIFRKFKLKSEKLRIALVCLITLLPINNPILHVNFIDVGQGDASLIHGQFNAFNILIDTGSEYNYTKLKKSLYAEGVYKINYLIITHDDEDHSGNIDNLENDFVIENIIREGKDINIGNLVFKYLDLGERNNDNDSSLVYLLEIDNHQILFTGDISKNVENRIINDFGISDIDILKVAHHGSKYSTSRYFIGNLLTDIATISTNGKYDHPSSEVINVLDSYLVKTYITKTSGNIKIYFTDIIDYLKTDKNECYIMN